MSLNKMAEQFKDFAELKEFADSQNKTIIKQSQEITMLQDEVKKLNQLLSSSNKDIDPATLAKEFKDLNDQQIICVKQLQMFRDKALLEELSLEECKKVDTYSKLLLAIEASKKQTPKSPTKDYSEKELLELLENGTE
jgi:uncharacterized membrane-anchored protein YhcB (DUF1043 family)